MAGKLNIEFREMHGKAFAALAAIVLTVAGFQQIVVVPPATASAPATPVA